MSTKKLVAMINAWADKHDYLVELTIAGFFKRKILIKVLQMPPKSLGFIDFNAWLHGPSASRFWVENRLLGSLSEWRWCQILMSLHAELAYKIQEFSK